MIKSRVAVAAGNVMAARQDQAASKLAGRYQALQEAGVRRSLRQGLAWSAVAVATGAPGSEGSSRGFHACAACGDSWSESMPGWWISRSRQNSRHRLRAMERSEVWSSSGARSVKYSTSRSRTGPHSMPYPSTICATLRRPSIRSAATSMVRWLGEHQCP